MIKLGGYLLTLFYLAGIFFPAWLTGAAAYLSQVSGQLAFAFFALLAARGARRTTNHFFYFVRLLAAALATELISFTASQRLGVWFEGKNALFTYASGLSLIAGISMAIGCYRDLVAHAVPAGGELNKKALFGVPVNPGNYRIAPLPGLAIGLATAGLSIFVALYFKFSHGLFGLLFLLLAFMAMEETEAPSPIFRRTVFLSRRACARTLLFIAVLAVSFILLGLTGNYFKAWMPTLYLFTLPAILLAALLPEGKKPGTALGRLYYAALPLATGVFCLIVCLI